MNAIACNVLLQFFPLNFYLKFNMFGMMRDDKSAYVSIAKKEKKNENIITTAQQHTVTMIECQLQSESG